MCIYSLIKYYNIVSKYFKKGYSRQKKSIITPQLLFPNLYDDFYRISQYYLYQKESCPCIWVK